MENNLTYKFMLNVNGLIPNNIFDDMACEACSIKFTLFKRKKQCRDCMRFFCTDCVIKRGDRVLSCDNCSMLSRRPLVRSQVLAMRVKDLKHYLTVKKISLRGCVEKEDLVNILMQYANGPESSLSNNEPTSNNSFPSSPRQRTNNPSPPRRSRSPPITIRETYETREPEQDQPLAAAAAQTPPRRSHNVEIEEVLEEETIATADTSEPLIDDDDDDDDDEQQVVNNDPHSPMFTELPTWTGSVKLAEIKESTDLEYLSVKQLKTLLQTNRVDFKGCVERSELLDRATRLWEAWKKNDETAAGEPDGGDGEGGGPYDESLCKICWDSPIECVILECGHLACCIECGKQMSECPICRQYVVRVVRFFKA